MDVYTNLHTQSHTRQGWATQQGPEEGVQVLVYIVI